MVEFEQTSWIGWMEGWHHRALGSCASCKLRFLCLYVEIFAEETMDSCDDFSWGKSRGPHEFQDGFVCPKKDGTKTQILDEEHDYFSGLTCSPWFWAPESRSQWDMAARSQKSSDCRSFKEVLQVSYRVSCVVFGLFGLFGVSNG